jgi:16S rRNA (cytosine1402-N4)-methyltransferase
MQIDDPARGFSWKTNGPLDMRLNPSRGVTASDLLHKASPAKLKALLEENADEPYAEILARTLAGAQLTNTRALADAVRESVKPLLRLRPDAESDEEKTVRRVFQALRIAVNEEFTALDTLLRVLPQCLHPGGRAAILTFHSGEDRRVKKAFAAWAADGGWILPEGQPLRPSSEEQRANPRSTSAKLRWIQRDPADA